MNLADVDSRAFSNAIRRFLDDHGLLAASARAQDRHLTFRSAGFRYHPAMSALAILVTTALIALQPSAGSREWFEKTEQTLMDAVASGDHAVWDQRRWTRPA